MMSRDSRRVSGILLLIFPTVIYGGVTLLGFLARDPSYTENALRQDMWRAGHAHAGVLLVLSLIVLRYVDDAVLSDRGKWFVRVGPPIAAILMPVAFFLSMPTAASTMPNPLINLAFIGALVLAVSLFALGLGLIRRPLSGGGF